MSLPPAAARYLVDLHDALALSPPERMRAVAEVEEHLVDAVAAAVASGTDAQAAADQAIARFGTVDEVAEAFRVDAGLHAAPYTFFRRFDVWRTRHLWLSAPVSAAPFLLPALVMPVLFSLFLPGLDRGWILRAFVDPLLPTMLACMCVGQVVLGHLVRHRLQSTFSARLRAYRADHPVWLALLWMGPLALGWELGVLASPRVGMRASTAALPLAFLAISLIGARRQGKAPLRVPSWVRSLAMPVAVAVGLLAMGALVGRGLLAGAVAGCAYALATLVVRALLRGRQPGPWVGALAFVGPVALAMVVFAAVDVGGVSVFTVGFPLGFTALMLPMLALNLRRSALEVQRQRLTAEAERI